MDADGQWMDEGGKVIKERTKVVILLHKDNKEMDEVIEHIRCKYKELFKQESVLKISTNIAERCF